jgi:hypothetical protein
MGRYRKVESKLWSDKKFNQLSAQKPSGQTLWLYFLTAPQPGPMPGLFNAGRKGLAETLGWSQKAFDKAFAELEALGMAKADFKARLVWLPHAIKYNMPASINVVKSWADELEFLPECALLTEAIEAFRQAVYAVVSTDKDGKEDKNSSGAFRKTFDEIFGKPAESPAEFKEEPSDKPTVIPSENHTGSPLESKAEGSEKPSGKENENDALLNNNNNSNNNKERKESSLPAETGDKKPPEQGGLVEWYEGRRRTWVSVGLPPSEIITNPVVLKDMRDTANTFPPEKCDEAIRNLGALVSSPGFNSDWLPGGHIPNQKNFLTRWVSSFINEAKPFENFRSRASPSGKADRAIQEDKKSLGGIEI